MANIRDIIAGTLIQESWEVDFTIGNDYESMEVFEGLNPYVPTREPEEELPPIKSKEEVVPLHVDEDEEEETFEW